MRVRPVLESRGKEKKEKARIGQIPLYRPLPLSLKQTLFDVCERPFSTSFVTAFPNRKEEGSSVRPSVRLSGCSGNRASVDIGNGGTRELENLRIGRTSLTDGGPPPEKQQGRVRAHRPSGPGALRVTVATLSSRFKETLSLLYYIKARHSVQLVKIA